MDDARRISRDCCSPAVPAIDYRASEEEYQRQMDEYRKAVETWGALPMTTDSISKKLLP